MIITIVNKRAKIVDTSYNRIVDITNCEIVINDGVLAIVECGNSLNIEWQTIQIDATLNGVQKIVPNYNFISVQDLQTQLEQYISDCDLFFLANTNEITVTGDTQEEIPAGKVIDTIVFDDATNSDFNVNIGIRGFGTGEILNNEFVPNGYGVFVVNYGIRTETTIYIIGTPKNTKTKIILK